MKKQPRAAQMERATKEPSIHPESIGTANLKRGTETPEAFVTSNSNRPGTYCCNVAELRLYLV